MRKSRRRYKSFGVLAPTNTPTLLFDYIKQFGDYQYFYMVTYKSITNAELIDLFHNNDKFEPLGVQPFASFNMYDDEGFTFCGGSYKFKFNNEELAYIVTPEGQDPYDPTGSRFICGNNIDTLQEIAEIIDACDVLQPGEIVIYDDDWKKLTAEEEAEIKACSWNDLILPEAQKKEIIEETENFISGKQKPKYEKLGLSYKRGFIMVGPPGGGKTLCARIIAATYGLPFICVRGISYSGDLNEIYDRAAKSAPCIVLIEDMDTLIHGGNRTKFLNMLDGLVSLKGILTIATTNHPEKLDPALLIRPSRFDKKWVFAIPKDKEIKQQYLHEKLLKLYDNNVIENCQSAIDKICKGKEKFTFAMLQELVILASFHADDEGTNLNKALLEAYEVAKQQLEYSDAEKLQKEMDDEDDSPLGFRA